MIAHNLESICKIKKIQNFITYCTVCCSVFQLSSYFILVNVVSLHLIEKETGFQSDEVKTSAQEKAG